MSDQVKQIQSWLSRTGQPKKALAQVIGIAPITLQRLLAGGSPSVHTQKLLTQYAQSHQQWFLYLDETFTDQTMIYISVTLVAAEFNDFPKLRKQLYPHGWQGAKREVKATGKADAWLKTLFTQVQTDEAQRFALLVHTAPTKLLPGGLAVVLPYLEAAALVIQRQRLGGQVQVILDQRSDFVPEVFTQAAQAISNSLKPQATDLAQVMVTQIDSKLSLGIQSSDFVARAASRWSPEICEEYGIAVLRADSMVTRTLIDEFNRTQPMISPVPGSAREAWLRLFELVQTIANWRQPALPYAKPVADRFNQLLALLPDPMPAGFKWPNQRNWYVLAAQVAMALRSRESQLDQTVASEALVTLVDELTVAVMQIQNLSQKNPDDFHN